MNRTLMTLSILVALSSGCAAGDSSIGVTATEIKIGATFPFSGPASGLANSGRGLLAYVQSINDRGGINGRKIDLMALDDAYSPPKAVEHTRRLIESDGVSFIFGTLGTPSNSAIVKYLNNKQVPHVSIVTGATKFTNVRNYPYTTTGLPSYDTEGKIYAKFIDSARPGAKIGILYQNDDMGKDFVASFKETLKDDFDKRVKAVSYEVSNPTVDSQVAILQSFGADSLMIAGTPKFAAQAIRRIHEVAWTPLIVINFISSSVSATLVPAGVENAIGVVSGSFYKDPNDEKWNDDASVRSYRAYFSQYLPHADIGDTTYLTGTQQGQILEALLRQCGDDLSRENINLQAHNLHLALPTFLDGIKINTSPTNSQEITQLKLRRWTGKVWEEFGDVVDASGVE